VNHSPTTIRTTLLGISIGSCLFLAAPSVHAQAGDPFEPLAEETRPLNTRWQTDYRGKLDAGIGYVSADNFMFGQYNGLYEQGAVVIGDIDWRRWRDDDDTQYWRLDARDLGLETRRGSLELGDAGGNRLAILFDSQVQVKNDSVRTPFRNISSSNLTLPGNWEGGANTTDWGQLDASLTGFEQKLQRQTWGLELDATLGRGWTLLSALSTEQKTGTANTAGAIYSDAANPHAAQLPMDVDQRTIKFDLAFDYQHRAGQFNINYHFADFDNNEDLLRWQNPYIAGFDTPDVPGGPLVDYPNGFGGMAQAPDNRFHRLRLTGSYIFSPKWLLQYDGSYGRTEQNGDFAAYTVNPTLSVTEPLPRTDLGGTVDTSTLALALRYRPMRKLSVEGRYHLKDRNNDSPRDGYQYVRGDGADQPASKYSNYNAPHDTRKQTAALEASYRFPKQNKLKVEYAFERVDRKNAAVEHTKENSLRAILNNNTLRRFHARVELLYADLAADTYDWAQSYYSRFDTELINETPDTQRYTNHPSLSQYHLSNRERTLGKIDLNYAASQYWNLALNMQWRRDDFDKSAFGLTDESNDNYLFSANYQARNDLSLTGYLNFGQYQSAQSSRAFRGGSEKNAFVTAPPYPQASDPSRDWDVDTKDSVRAIGFALEWLAMERLSLGFDYSFVDTNGENDFATYGAEDVSAQPLPDRKTQQHQLVFSGDYQLKDNLSLNLDYQYFYYQSDNWAIDEVEPDTLNKVLSFGEESPDEGISYIGLSVTYRLR
jgi:MtrB/PioB family decaheme-associated outer membrane protein